ncbi:outer membrane protein [Prosthecomicrobium sp. N25]|uniref:outer membrane protein n=1 Tax=Prosthecomicrobium sp. N25 TaxID=3129254 RepID=UPI003076C620
MTRFSSLPAALLVFGMSAGAACAADLSRPAPVAPAAPAYPETIAAYGFNWTGAYVGANVGYRWLDDKASGAAGRANLNSGSAAGGLQAGYLFQTGPMVYGAELDATYGRNSKSANVPGGRIDAAMDWQGSARGRLGFAFDRVLVYGTGGVAVANFDSDGHGGGKTATNSDTRVGWTAGGGLEYALSKNVSLRGEYLYSDFGRNSVSYPGTGLGGSKQDLTSHLARLGVNFKF